MKEKEKHLGLHIISYLSVSSKQQICLFIDFFLMSLFSLISRISDRLQRHIWWS